MRNINGTVRERYAAAAEEREPELCCPVTYDPESLSHIPQEILEKDYGCGDPSRYLLPGDTVLDLGSGAGKICYIAAKQVGPSGRVIGVDFNPPMLALARGYQGEVAEKLGYSNVEFRRGQIQDLALDLDLLEEYLTSSPIHDLAGLESLEEEKERLRAERPLVASDTVDAVVSNCVLNLVRPADKERLFDELFRVLRRGGRAVISDIVSDEEVPEHLQQNPDLWSGCISGAFREERFLEMFERAGFYGAEILKRDETPWRIVEGIEFRAMTVRAWKGKQGPCLERKQAVIYRGPWRRVIDDDGHILVRGQRTAVCDKTYQIYTRAPYTQDILPLSPREEILLDEAAEFDCRRSALRHPRETKGQDYTITIEANGSSCSNEGCC